MYVYVNILQLGYKGIHTLEFGYLKHHLINTKMRKKEHFTIMKMIYVLVIWSRAVSTYGEIFEMLFQFLNALQFRT